jgi:hypothetical protein
MVGFAGPQRASAIARDIILVKPDLEMRAHLAAIFSLVAILSLIVPAQSEEIPNLDVAQLCRGIAGQAKDPMAGGEPTRYI